MVDNAPKTMNERNTLGQCPQGIVHNGGKKNPRFTQVTSVANERIFQSNALKGVGIASVDGCNERSTPEKKRRMPPPCLASKTDGLLDSAEGCKHKPQAADKQASVL